MLKSCNCSAYSIAFGCYQCTTRKEKKRIERSKTTQEKNSLVKNENFFSLFLPSIQSYFLNSIWKWFCIWKFCKKKKKKSNHFAFQTVSRFHKTDIEYFACYIIDCYCWSTDSNGEKWKHFQSINLREFRLNNNNKKCNKKLIVVSVRNKMNYIGSQMTFIVSFFFLSSS